MKKRKRTETVVQEIPSRMKNRNGVDKLLRYIVYLECGNMSEMAAKLGFKIQGALYPQLNLRERGLGLQFATKLADFLMDQYGIEVGVAWVANLATHGGSKRWIRLGEHVRQAIKERDRDLTDE